MNQLPLLQYTNRTIQVIEVTGEAIPILALFLCIQPDKIDSISEIFFSGLVTVLEHQEVKWKGWKNCSLAILWMVKCNGYPSCIYLGILRLIAGRPS